MKRIVKLIIILGTFLMFSCMDMYNEIAEEMEGYNYFLTVAGNESNAPIRIYSVDSSGNITNKTWTSTTPTDNRRAYSFATSPDGNYLYVAYQTINKLYVYHVNNDGSLTEIDTDNSASTPNTVKVHPSGKYVYYTNYASDTVAMYKVTDDGKLDIIGTTGTISTGAGPKGLATDPSGSYLYVANNTAKTITRYKINNDGSLTPLTDTVDLSSYTNSPDKIVIHPEGKYLYVSITKELDAGFNSIIIPFLISDSGLLTKLTSSSIQASLGGLAIHPLGTYVYSGACVNSNIGYRIIANPIKTDYTLDNYSLIGAGSDPQCIIVHPNGYYLYAGSQGSGEFFAVKLNNDGTFNGATKLFSFSVYNLALIRQKK